MVWYKQEGELCDTPSPPSPLVAIHTSPTILDHHSTLVHQHLSPPYLPPPIPQAKIILLSQKLSGVENWIAGMCVENVKGMKYLCRK